MATFKELGLNSEIMRSLDDLGFTEPTAIQEQAIPFLLKEKKDLIALAQTGTGKTAAFSLPILNQIKADNKELQAIILCPTRELCLQISQDIRKFAKHSKGVSVTPVYGGERMDVQISALRRGTDIIVGTPGRVHDLIRRKFLCLKTVRWVVLDEADEMLKMGFKDDMDVILGETPSSRQTLLFSATMSGSVHSISSRYMKDAGEISIGEKNAGADNVSHEYYVVHIKDRFEALKRILDYLPGVYGILFCRTKRETQEISDRLRDARYDAEALHGDITQSARTKIMDRFKRKQIKLLVATDVAARGIDVNNLSHVINYNLPDQNEAYTHRSGRTGRAQNSGVAISIVGQRDIRAIREIEYIIGKKIERKNIPSGKDICKKQIEIFLEEVVTADMEKFGDEEYFKKAAEKFKKIKKEDLIKHFIAHKFNPLLDECGNTGDLNCEVSDFHARKETGDNANLKINFGRRHGFDIKGLFALFNSDKNLKYIRIGRINLMRECTIFSVERQCAERLAQYLQGKSFRGGKIDISMTDEQLGYSEMRSGVRPGRGKRRNGRGSREYGRRYFKK